VFISKNIFFSLIISLIIDLLFGNYLINFIHKDPEKSFRKRHFIYHHDLKKSINTISNWGGQNYNICTDASGFKSSCINQHLLTKEYDIGIIGDSFTEGVGLDYEQTFVGLIEKYEKINNENIKIANLGVVSYSPSIYYSKVKFLLNNGYKFKKIIVFIDISDLQDEATSYVLNGDFVIPFSEKLNIYKIKVLMNILFPLSYNALLNIYHQKRVNIENIENIENLNSHGIYGKKNTRSGWTWGVKNGYEPLGVEVAHEKNLKIMNNLYDLLNENNIQLSVGVYPWPGQILYDDENSTHVNIWKKYCINKCEYFYNLFPILFNQKNLYGSNYVIDNFYIKNDVHFNSNGQKLFLNEYIIKSSK